jgi:hypothetical protein
MAQNEQTLRQQRSHPDPGEQASAHRLAEQQRWAPPHRAAQPWASRLPCPLVQTLFPVPPAPPAAPAQHTRACLGQHSNTYNTRKIHRELSIVTMSARLGGTEHACVVIQPSPPSISRTYSSAPFNTSSPGLLSYLLALLPDDSGMSCKWSHL